MLEHIFGSKTRVKLLTLFLQNTDKSYFVRELTRKLKIQINAIRRELTNLEQFGIVKVDIKDKIDDKSEKKYYQTNTDFILYSELKSLFIKSQLLTRQNLFNQLISIGKIDYLLLTGMFVGQRDPFKTDVLIVGNVNKTKLSNLLKIFEDEFGYEVNYTIMSRDEFKYRKDITDKFLYDILGGKKIILVDKFIQNEKK